ncbi:dihydrolipoamide acetyltransferase family protein [Persephonella sp.]
MEYKVVMPQLTDTMEEGKIIRWLKKEGDYVKKDEPLVEIESDKAVMDVPAMREGVLVKILAEEGEELPVGKPIAIIETDVEEAKKAQKTVSTETTPETKKEEKAEEKPAEPQGISVETEVIPERKPLPEGTASPSARKLAGKLGLDIKKLQEKGKLPVPAHKKDVEDYFYRQFFTPQAIKLLEEYGLDPRQVYTDIGRKKIDKKTVENYIKEKNIPKVSSPSDIQRILIKNLSKSTQIPVYHITEEIDVSHLLENQKITLTAYLIKLLGDTMADHPRTRTVYREDRFYTYPSSNVSVAIAVGEELFNPTIKNVESLSVEEVYSRLRQLKQKAENKVLSVEDIQGATFSISNLGMFGIKKFDAVLPPFHCGIAGVGTAVNGIITVTFTFDHRIINGAQAAVFVVDLKKRTEDRSYFSKK